MEAPSTASGSANAESIRGYRARKIRPCDNCRSRRKRCLIPSVGQPCALCVQTQKHCTFLRKRPSRAKSQSDTVSPTAQMSSHTNSIPEEPLKFVSLPDPPSQPVLWSIPNISSTSSIPYTSHISPTLTTNAPSMTTSAMLERIRQARQTQPVNIVPFIPVISHVALDDEAAHDEELYLAGTASERDALILNNLTMGDSVSAPGTTDVPGLRIRVVSPNVSFVFYKTLPYGMDGADESGSVWRQVEAMVGSAVASEAVDKFFEIEGQGLPIFHPISHFHLPDSLRSLCLSAGLIYMPSHRHFHRPSYMTTSAHMRQQAPRARLWTLQAYLLDLNGREAINPSGNFVVLGLAVSVARLLGLHEDCSGWTIPEWEKTVRIRLWWALLSYDKLSSLTFGRTRTMQFETHVPLPARGRNPTPSLDAFISLCELTNLLDDLPTTNTPGITEHLDRISVIALDLDQWKAKIDNRGLLLNISAPGVQSLHLAYLGARLMVVRATWDQIGTSVTDPAQFQLQTACQDGCLKTCEEIVSFVCGLSNADLAGYWSSHSPFILSFCLTLLVRLIMASDRSDQSDTAIWQIALFALRRFISALTGYLDQSQWDIARLVLSRARYFIPLLARQASEIQVTLWPLQNELGGELPHDQSMDDFINSIFNPMGLDMM